MNLRGGVRLGERQSSTLPIFKSLWNFTGLNGFFSLRIPAREYSEPLSFCPAAEERFVTCEQKPSEAWRPDEH